MSAPQMTLEYCGEWFTPNPDDSFEIGREGDLTIDDNPYLHRKFLRISQQDGIWWLSNVGSLLSATVCDTGGGVQSWLSPGNRIPIVFQSTTIVFTAGPTTYEVLTHLSGQQFETATVAAPETGEQTIGMINSLLLCVSRCCAVRVLVLHRFLPLQMLLSVWVGLLLVLTVSWIMCVTSWTGWVLRACVAGLSN